MFRPSPDRSPTVPDDIGRAWAPFVVLAVFVFWLADREHTSTTIVLGLVVVALVLRALQPRFPWIPDVVGLLLELFVEIAPLALALAQRRWLWAAVFAAALLTRIFQTGREIRDELRERQTHQGA